MFGNSHFRAWGFGVTVAVKGRRGLKEGWVAGSYLEDHAT